MAQQKTIKRLNELKGVSVKDFINLYTNNIAFIDCQEHTRVRQILKSKNVVPTLHNLRSALLKKVNDFIPNHSILKKKLLNSKDDVCNDIMTLAPLSYISQETHETDKEDNTLAIVQNESDVQINNNTIEAAATKEVRTVDSGIDTASGCSKCGAGDNPTRVAELELKVAALEQEIASYKGVETQYFIQNGDEDEISNRTTVAKVHINEFLCYIFFSLRANNEAYLVNILKSKYDIKEIKAGKNLLWKLCGNHLTPYQNRLGSSNREAKDAHINDVIEAVHNLDVQDRLPKFVAENLGKLPGIQPEELNQLYYINRVASLEAQSRQHKDELVNLNSEIFQLKDDFTQQLDVVKQQLRVTDKPKNSGDMLKDGPVDAKEVADTISNNDNRESEAIQQEKNQDEPEVVILDENNDDSDDTKTRHDARVRKYSESEIGKSIKDQRKEYEYYEQQQKQKQQQQQQQQQ